MAKVKYPDITIELTGKSHVPHDIIKMVRTAMKNSGVAESEIAEFVRDATRRNYQHLIKVVELTVNTK